MASKKKCFIGSTFGSLDELLMWIDADFWVFIGPRAFHPSFIRNRMLGKVRGELREGTIQTCYDVNGEPYITDQLILDAETKDILGTNVVDMFEQDRGSIEFYAENDGYGIVGWSFDCPYCNYANRFVDESDSDHECGKCHKPLKLVPITYSSTAIETEA
jgi:hypothetical protein